MGMTSDHDFFREQISRFVKNRVSPFAMVGHQHPCITPAASQRKILFKSAKKVIPVTVVKKDILAIQTPGDDMMNRNWGY
jgi:hypothetical protein